MDRVIVFSHEDEFLFELSESDVYELRRHEEINGEHYLTITTTTVLQKEQRILTQDATGKWYEWVVTTEDMEHAGGSYMVGTYMAVWSLQHDLSTVPVSVMPGTGGVLVSAEQALTSLLSTTGRWGVGTVTVTTVGSASMYRTLVWDGLATLIATWGGEVDAEITVDNMKVTSRAVSLWAYQGSTEATRRFDYGADITSIKRRVESDPFACRIIPLGKGEESGEGYGRKITIEEVNDNKDYLQNDSVVAYVRRPTASGYEYPTIYAENSEIDSPAELKTWGESVLESLTEPRVTYEATVLQLSQAGMDAYGIALGDLVQCVDRKFMPEGLRVSGRVTCIDANLLDPSDTQVTIGYLSKSLSAAMQQALSSLDSRIDTAVAMSEGVAGLSQDYVQRILDRLNEEINLTGGYFYITEGWGVRTYDTAVTDPLVGAEASQVVEIRGGNIRIANSRTSSGDWDWKTVIQSGHLAIDLVTAARLISGYIGSPSGNYWNLDTGEFRLAATASLGGKTVQEVLSAYDDTITGVDVEYAQSTSSTSAPLTGWSTTAPTYEAGKYIWSRTKTTTPSGNSYSTPVMISGRDGTSGVGIASTTISYGTSASGSTQPSSWQSAVPSVSQGYWLWIRTVYAYTDGSEKTTYAKSYVGTDGQDGRSVYVQSSTKVDGVTTIVLTDGTTTSTITIADGEDGDNGQAGANGYVHIAWATSADGSQGFSTSVSTGKTYIGVYTDNTQADSQSYRDYSWSLIKGEDGTGITSIVEQYYLSTSNTTQTGGSWSTDQPEWSEGHYIWTRSLITWDTTPATTTTTTPVLAKALNGANEAAAQAQGSVDAISTQEAIFNLLTNNGALQGLFMQNNQLYINSSYVQSGILKLGGLNNQSGILQVFDASGNVLSQLDVNGLVLILDGFTRDSKHNAKMGYVSGYDLSGNSVTYRGLEIATSGESTADNTLMLAACDTSASTSNGESYRDAQIVSLGGLRLYSHASAQSLGTYIVMDQNSFRIGSKATSGHTLVQLGQTQFQYSSASDGVSHVFYGSLTVSGGTKSRLAKTDYGDRLLYCDETPAPTFTDFGSGTIGDDGLCYVEIDPVFADTVNTSMAYQVFLQKCGRGDLWVAEKHADYFVVEGDAGLAFDWQLKAHQSEYETLRLEDYGIERTVANDNANVVISEFASVYDDDIRYVELIESLYESELA